MIIGSHTKALGDPSNDGDVSDDTGPITLDSPPLERGDAEQRGHSEDGHANERGDAEERDRANDGEAKRSISLSSPPGRLPRPSRRAMVDAASFAVIVGGLSLLLFALYQLGWSGYSESRVQKRLANELATSIEYFRALADAPSIDGNVTELPVLERGDPVGLLEVPSIDLERVVVEGTSAEELDGGPGHVMGMSLPGQAGNSVIFGHRTLYGGAFSKLDRLRKGDKITLTTPQGRFTYLVEKSQVISPGKEDVLAQGATNQLTLATAHPRYRSSKRLAVVAKLQGDAYTAGVPSSRPRLSTGELGLAADIDSLPGALLWGQAFFIALMGARLLYRRWLRGATYLITTPVVCATGLLSFESLARLLPSTL